MGAQRVEFKKPEEIIFVEDDRDSTLNQHSHYTQYPILESDASEIYFLTAIFSHSVGKARLEPCKKDILC